MAASEKSNTAYDHNLPTAVDIREEYANAFRTESYLDFWTRVITLSHANSTTCSIPTIASRLPSYRLFVEHLLDPDQPTVTRILALSRIRPVYRSILFDYFTQTANTSLLCGILLKDIDRIRIVHHLIKTTLQSLDATNFSLVLTGLHDFVNPFVSTASSPTWVRAVRASCSGLLKQLESNRDKTRAKLRLANGLKRGSAIFLVALTASLTIIVAAHAIALLVATPGLIAASLELASVRSLARVTAQLDAAAKGTYILNRDMDTISRLVARLNDELEHMRAMVKFWAERKEDRLEASDEVARQLKKNDCSFSQQLDELEEHLYLCFMTVNRARNLVIKEMVDPGQPS
ncbi:UPF0496 protein At3g49070 [Corylus avellana]|uniref:UPF0496 protein At3g49070 n=1 Tax=Corylus avellana TaxID=13451 RepID=UPI00286CD4BF|nr:UPF0496 protein At3g49070 [Corylus avellana]